MGKPFIAAVVALSLVGSASAEEDTLQSANTVMPGCRAVLNHDPAEAFGRGMCIGIITALATGTFQLVLIATLRRFGRKRVSAAARGRAVADGLNPRALAPA